MNYLFEKKSRFRFVLYGFGTLLIFAFASLCSFAVSFFEGVAYPSKNHKLILMFLPFLGAMVVLFCTVQYVLKTPFKRLITTRNRIDFKRFFVGFLLWFCLLFVMQFAFIFFQPEHFVFHFQPLRFLGLLFVMVVFVPIQAMFEEVFFRGYVSQMIFTVVRSRWLVVVFAAVFFALMHFSNPEVNSLGYALLLVYFLWGVFFSLVTFFDGGMELTMGMHTAHNLCLALLVSYESTVLKTDALFISDQKIPSFWWQIIVFFGVAIPVFFFFKKRYDWDF